MSFNKPTLAQIAVNGSTTLDQVINSSGAWIGSPTGLQGATGATDFIKSLYQDDYDFFESKGIKFNV